MQPMGRCHGPLAHPVGRRSVLVRRDVWMLATYLLATHRTAAHRHPVLGHLWTGNGRDIRGRDDVDAFCFQPSRHRRDKPPASPERPRVAR